jgi:Na+/proline symporter
VPSWGALVLLVFMAAGVFFAGLPVRRFLRGRAKKSLNPLRAMRTLVLAQAAALTGALVAGWYVAQVLVLLPDFDVHSLRSLGLRVAALAAGGVLLATAGLVAQAMCRVDGDHPDRDLDRDRDDEADPQER